MAHTPAGKTSQTGPPSSPCPHNNSHPPGNSRTKRSPGQSFRPLESPHRHPSCPSQSGSFREIYANEPLALASQKPQTPPPSVLFHPSSEELMASVPGNRPAASFPLMEGCKKIKTIPGGHMGTKRVGPGPVKSRQLH